MDKIIPNWNVPKHIHALTTLRTGGVSKPPFDSFNLGDHVNDEPQDIAQNRALLVEKFQLPQAPLFLTQTHSTRVIELPYSGDNIKADAIYTNQRKPSLLSDDCRLFAGIICQPRRVGNCGGTRRLAWVMRWHIRGDGREIQLPATRNISLARAGYRTECFSSRE